MKPFLRKGAVLLASAMVVTSMAPAGITAYAAKSFTYAYQTGGTVSKLTLEKGNSVDLKFIGVPDYQSYTWNWISSNPDVAVVDRAGVVTARSEGTAVISLIGGDGSVYTSQGRGG